MRRCNFADGSVSSVKPTVSSSLSTLTNQSNGHDDFTLPGVLVNDLERLSGVYVSEREDA